MNGGFINRFLDVFFYTTEVDIEFVEVLKERAEGGALGHFCKSVYILGEALTTVAKLAVRTGNVGVGIVDITGEQYARMNLAPVGTHLLAILAASVEVGHFVGTEYVVHVLSEFGFKRRHNGEFLANKDLGEQAPEHR